MSPYIPVKGQLIAVEVNRQMRWGLFRLGMKGLYRYGTMRGPHLELWISLLTEGRHPRLCSEEMKSHSFMRVFRIRRSCWLRLRRSDFWTTGFLSKGEQEVFAMLWGRLPPVFMILLKKFELRC